MLQDAEWRALIVFWENGDIIRSLVWSDFQACMDGYAPLQIFSRRTLQATYVELDAYLHPAAFVFFEIAFDEQGWAERSWNLPLRHMAEVAEAGPDLGYGVVRLVCRSQNPMSWLSDRLWDPLLQAAHNEFEQISRVLQITAPRLGWQAQVKEMAQPGQAPSEAVPLLAERVAPGVDREQVLRLEGERDALKRELEERDLRLRTMGSEHMQQSMRAQFEHEQALAILQAQHAKLLAQQKALKEQNDALTQELDLLHGQLQNSEARSRIAMQDAEVDMQLQLQRLQRDHADTMHHSLELANLRWREEVLRHEQVLRLELEAERSLRVEQDHAWQQKLQVLRDQLEAKEREMSALRVQLTHSASRGAEDFLARLEHLGMNFLVYHAGVGHISVPVSDLSAYVSDPLAYAAKKCYVSAELYRSWLQHYDDPRCSYQSAQGTPCDARIIRVDSPARFTPGESDRCARHHTDSNIDAVLKFRASPGSTGEAL